MQETILKVRYFERGLSKSLKKGNFNFSAKPSPFQWENYKKQKGPGTSNQPPLRLRNKFSKIPKSVNYYSYVII